MIDTALLLVPARVFFRVVLPVAAWSLGGVRAQGDEVRDVTEHWYRLEISGVRVGHGFVRSETVRRGEEELLGYTEGGELNFGRLGQAARIESESRTLERPDGSMVEAVGMSTMSTQQNRVTARFDGDSVEIVTTTLGRERTRSLEIPPETCGPRSLRRRVVAALAAAPTDFAATIWSAEAGDAVDVQVFVEAKEWVVVGAGDGERREAFRVRYEYDGLPSSYTGWYDANGLELKSILRSSGLEIVGIWTTRADALADDEGGDLALPDLVAATAVVARHHLPAPRRSGRALLKVAVREGDWAAPLPESSRQRVLRRTADGRQLWIETRALRPMPDPGRERQAAAWTDDVAAYLAPSASVQCDAEVLRAKAQELVGQERDPWRAAQHLEDWVGEHIADKNMQVAWASALEVFEVGAGDCSEHAVLMAAMCRAAGVPCRVVFGCLYIGGIWAGHAWNEVWVDGDWYALDATVAVGRADALRLALSVTSLGDDDGAERFAGIAGNLGNLDIEVLELGSDVPRRPAEDHGHLANGRYVDRLFGIDLVVPEGLDLVCRPPTATLSFDILATDDDAADQPFHFALRVFDATPDGSIPGYLKPERGAAATVDGRPARDEFRVDRRRVLVVADGVVFEFRFEDVDDADLEAIERLLDSVDFDGR